MTLNLKTVGTTPVTGTDPQLLLPSNNSSPALSFTPLGIQSVTFGPQGVTIVAKPGFSGLATIEFTVVINGVTQTIIVHLTVLPEPAMNVVVAPVTLAASELTWAPSVNALKYVVTDAGQPLCSTSGTDCPIAKLYTIVTAPKIEVQAIGANSTKSTLIP